LWECDDADAGLWEYAVDGYAVFVSSPEDLFEEVAARIKSRWRHRDAVKAAGKQ
jgi:hypothetical protein